MDTREFSPSEPVEFYNNANDTKDTFSDKEEEVNDSNLILQKGQSFESFEHVEQYLMQYSAQYQPRKDKDTEKYCKRNSGSIGCQWQLNTSFSGEIKADILEYLTAVPTKHHKNLYNAIQEVRRCNRKYKRNDAENMLYELHMHN
ncbi:514_t:CDS:2 [Funneliformis geosporum]|nr:514_t:CDS:2 [Funneliformis geosporum]